MKKYLNLLICLLLVFTLTGCGTKEGKVETNNKEEEQKEENKNTVVSCTTNEDFWYDPQEKLEKAIMIISAEFDKSGKIVKTSISYELELKTSDKDLIEEYREEADELCTDDNSDNFSTCKTTVDGRKITSKAEYKSSYIEESEEFLTQEKFIETFEEDNYMTCTIK
ncbi:MAG: hypothetical protein E7162_05675 [Firmicutes bacterium]|nr:hypothetical protein [Bacillota bacterium]